MERSGTEAGRTVVGSDATLFAVFVSPPPETIATFVTLVMKDAAIFTVRVIGG
jgi:hypothetical protein